MTNLFNTARRTIIGAAGALLLSVAFLAVSAGPALISTPQVTTQSA